MMTGSSRFGFVLLLAGALVVTCWWISSQDADRPTTPRSLVAATYEESPSADVFYVLGAVERPGSYTLTGRQVTVRMALAASGTQPTISFPARATLVRRIGQDQEQVFALNVERILSCADPDMYLKPNDVLVVDVDASALADWPDGPGAPTQPVARSASARRFTRW